ncbi:MAG: fatty acid desaturase [Ferruginibacter sp.]
MNARALKYLSPILLYSCSAISFTHTGFYTWLPVLYAFAIVPLAELFVAPSATNMEDAEEDLARKNPFYDGFLYIIVPLQAAALFLFLNTIQTPGLAGWETAGRIISMGLLCGTFGINVGHELGHRSKQYEQAMAKFLLSTSLYIHFFIEHNKGHHRHVATPQDPSSARYNEPVYLFYFRTIIFSYISAWQIANEETWRRGKPVFSFYNRMLTTQALQLLLPAAILLIFGPWVLAAFVAAACFGILLLETVN